MYVVVDSIRSAKLPDQSNQKTNPKIKMDRNAIDSKQKGKTNDTVMPSPFSDDTRRAYNDEFYLRYYVGHKGQFGHEFMVNNVISFVHYFFKLISITNL